MRIVIATTIAEELVVPAPVPPLPVDIGKWIRVFSAHAIMMHRDVNFKGREGFSLDANHDSLNPPLYPTLLSPTKGPDPVAGIVVGMLTVVATIRVMDMVTVVVITLGVITLEGIIRGGLRGPGLGPNAVTPVALVLALGVGIGPLPLGTVVGPLGTEVDPLVTVAGPPGITVGPRSVVVAPPPCLPPPLPIGIRG